MTFEKFVEIVKVKIEEKLGTKYEIELREVTKNNDVKLTGLAIKLKDSNIGPMIYLNSFYQEYVDSYGASMDGIVKEILKIYEENEDEHTAFDNFNPNTLMDFETTKHLISFRLFNTEKNKDLLEKIPHLDFLDMSIGFHGIIKGKNDQHGYFIITNDLMKNWNTTLKELMALAEVNSPKLCPAIHDYMHRLVPVPPTPLYIISSYENHYGAAVILQKNLLKEISEKLGGDMFLLPSSVHEFLALGADGDVDERKEELKNTIRHANQNAVKNTDFLSDNLYFYDHKNNTIKILN